MRFNIDWIFFLAVETLQKGEKILGRIADSLDLGLSGVEIERYWKEKSMLRVSARSCLDATSPKDALYSILTRIGHLAPSWQINGPIEDDEWEFSGVTSAGSLRLPGVDAISFTMTKEHEQQIASCIFPSEIHSEDSSVEFRTTVSTEGSMSSIGEAIAAKREELKRLRPEIQRIEIKLEVRDLSAKVGAEYRAKVTGMIFFKPDSKPDLIELQRAGQQCFENDFTLMPRRRPAMNDEFVMKFPVYSLLLKDGSGVILLRAGSHLWLPLFTDRDAVQTYLERSEIKECCIIELPTPNNLAQFLEKPPSRAGKNAFDTVIVDPIDPQPGTVTLFKVTDLLKSLRARTNMTENRLKTSVSGAIWSDKQLSEQVSAANSELLDVIGKDGAPVNADWSLGKDEKERVLVILKLRDHTGAVELKFAPEELSNPRARLHRAWGDLLRGSSS